MTLDQLTPEQIEFLRARGQDYQSTAVLGKGAAYLRNIGRAEAEAYRDIYHIMIDASLVLTMGCGGCVFDMVRKLWLYVEPLGVLNSEPLKEAKGVATIPPPTSADLADKEHLDPVTGKPINMEKWVSEVVPGTFTDQGSMLQREEAPLDTDLPIDFAPVLNSVVEQANAIQDQHEEDAKTRANTDPEKDQRDEDAELSRILGEDKPAAPAKKTRTRKPKN